MSYLDEDSFYDSYDLEPDYPDYDLIEDTERLLMQKVQDGGDNRDSTC